MSAAQSFSTKAERVRSTSDNEMGILIGKYQHRGNAPKTVAEAAYKPEPMR
ncbi:MAG: hypothetical protein WCD70_15440 [Alphaproteobacteria bacterium]